MNEEQIALFWSYVDRRGPDECWPWIAGQNDGGYGIFYIDGKAHGSHRVAFLLTHGHWPEPCGLHSCDVRYASGDITNRRCCNPAHLFEGTRGENMAWMVAAGRSTFGERQPNAKLTETSARALLALKGTMTQCKAGALFGIHQAHVSRIWSGRFWSHLER